MLMLLTTIAKASEKYSVNALDLMFLAKSLKK
jgi:hypothetical protein